MRRRHRWLARSSAVGFACALATATGARAAAPMLRDSSGLKVLSEKQLDSRLIELSVSTAALPGPAKIRLLLPPDYSSNLGRRYPVFYLLHGTSGGASDWTVMGDAEKTTAGLPVIVVMPDIALNDNGGGWCTNWVNGGAYGVPEWETFHVAQLIPWVDQNLRTIGTRQGRAIAGLSQGGFCSMSYAARHPDLFSIALAYSGAPDIAYDQGDAAGSTAIINATEFGLDGVPPNSMFGDRATNEVNWADHDPATLANNLRGLDLFMYVGNGVPGPLDSSPVNPEASLIEGAVHQDTFDFHDRLDALSIPSYYDDYGPGTHSWPYWTRDLQQSIGPIMDDFAHPPPDPAGITYTTADAQYSVYGWEVSMHRPAEEFSTLEDADAQGFAVAGSGSGTVRTPPMFAPGASYAVTLRGTNVSQAATSVADPHGRLSIDVPLGPPNPYQQDTAAAMAAGTTVYTTTVSIQESRQPVSDIPSATLSGSRACLSRRRLTIHAGAPRGARVTVLVNGRRRRFIRVGGGVQLSLAGRTKGTYRVEVRIGARGALRTVTHTFHTCRPGRRGTR